MITKNDCLLLLADIEANGVDTQSVVKELIQSGKPTINVVKFINDNRKLDLTNFYEKIRRSYNDKKSSLYINIMKEIEEPSNILTTLSSMQLQIMLYYNQKAEDKEMFLKHSRAKEICECIYRYINTNDYIPGMKLLRLIKTDIKALESVNRKGE